MAPPEPSPCPAPPIQNLLGTPPYCENALFQSIASLNNPDHFGTEKLAYSAGDAIYRHGMAGLHIYAVCKGLVRLDQNLPEGHMKTIRMLQAGSIFGLETLSSGQYLHDAVSVGRSLLCRIRTPALHQLASSDSAWHQQLMHEWKCALEEADFVITHLSSGNARQRVARLLLHLSKPDASQQEGICQAPPRENMASLLGLTPETVSRATASLKRDGLISEARGAIRCNRCGLLHVSEACETTTPKSVP